MVFPLAIFQKPFFDKDNLVHSYGGIGTVIAHEITHGFDDQGSKYNGDGNLENWWKAEDLKAFEERVQCIKDEYSEFYFDEAQMYVDGNLTAGENTADNGGLWEAAYALEKSIARSADKFVWGLSDKFTQDQLFYIGYGQIWCSLYRPEYAVWLVQNDPHSPDRFRINGAVQNADGFAKAFGCRKGAPMAPHQTCRVW